MNPLIEMLETAESHYQSARRELLESQSQRGLLRRMTAAAVAYATLCECLAQAHEEGIV